MIDWNTLSPAAQKVMLQRPAVSAADDVRPVCEEILKRVQSDGDSALRGYANRFDGRATDAPLLCSDLDFADAEQALDPELKDAIKQAYNNIRRFHLAQVPKNISLSTQPGVAWSCATRPSTPSAYTCQAAVRHCLPRY